MMNMRLLPIIFGLSSTFAHAQVDRQGDAYQIRIRFKPGQRSSYQIVRETMRAKVPPYSSIVDLRCSSAVNGRFEVEAKERTTGNQDRTPLDQIAKIDNRGLSRNFLTFWLTPCPASPVKLHTPWQGSPPPFSSTLGLRPNSTVTYQLEKVDATSATVSFACIQAPTRRDPQEIDFRGAIILDTSTGQFISLKLERLEPRMASDRFATGTKPSFATSIIRI